MKTIKIKYIGFWSGFNPDTFYVTEILKKHFNVVITDDPDFIICSCIGDFYEFLKYPQVRIEYIGENYIPDMNVIDYAISPYPIQFLDRCFHLPQGLKGFEVNHHCAERSKNQKPFDQSFLESKTIFANFCASHESEYGIRGDFFKKLCEYKKVDSIGTYLNNTGIIVKMQDGSKKEYLRKCKFTLCFESTSHGGFNTEKITDAFYTNTIPVYYGDPYISTIFNPNAFINVSDYNSIEEAIERIIELDQNDDLYLQMLNQPVFNDPDYPYRLEKEFEEFLVHIFSQEPSEAYRRSRIYFPKYFESFLRNCSRIYYSPIIQIGQKLKRKLRH